MLLYFAGSAPEAEPIPEPSPCRFKAYTYKITDTHGLHTQERV